MSQRKAADEERLEHLENVLAHGARIRRALEIVEHKVQRAMPNQTVMGTTLEDLQEAQVYLRRQQAEIEKLIKKMGL